MEIRKVEQYFSKDGQQIERFIDTLGVAPDIFVGTVILSVPTPRGQIQQPLRFEIAAGSIFDAFFAFKTAADAAVKEHIANVSKPRLALPGRN